MNTQTHPVGLTKDTGWQIGVRRTLPVSPDKLWNFMVSMRGIELWLGKGDPFELQEGATYQLQDGTAGEVRVMKSLSHWRITRLPQDTEYQRPSIIQIRILDSGGKSILAFHEEHLPTEKERGNRKAFYLDAAETILSLIEQGEI
jgi:hypothetical protein